VNNTAKPVMPDPDRVNVALNQGVNTLLLNVDYLTTAPHEAMSRSRRRQTPR
jgi:hypothetical protein